MALSRVGPEQLAEALAPVLGWLDGAEPDPPARAVLASAVRTSLRALAQAAPGRAVEVRVPPFAAVQCLEGPRHTRGTPPNVLETDPGTWLALATGRVSFAAAHAGGRLAASGSRAGDVAKWLPVSLSSQTAGAITPTG